MILFTLRFYSITLKRREGSDTIAGSEGRDATDVNHDDEDVDTVL